MGKLLIEADKLAQKLNLRVKKKGVAEKKHFFYFTGTSLE